MAILLGALFVLGQETGPNMLTYHVDVVFIMIFTIIIGNLIGSRLVMQGGGALANADDARRAASAARAAGPIGCPVQPRAEVCVSAEDTASILP